VIVSAELPNRYRAHTTILIVPQRIPQEYVRSTVTTRIEDRLRMISQQILSRTRLEQILQEFNLYPEEREDRIMEDVIELMRKDISVNIDTQRRRNDNASAFTVSFTARDGRTAMRVTERLASLFIKENLQDREVLADATSQFIEAQLEDARRRLTEHERKLEDYKRRHSGELPTQAGANLQVLQATQMQLQNHGESLNRDRDRKVLVERLLGDVMAEQQGAAAPVANGTSQDPPANAPAAARLAAATSVLRALELRLKPQHPDVVKMKRTVAEIEREAEAEALQQPVAPGVGPAVVARGVSPGEAQRQRRMTELRTELETLDRRMAAKQVDEQRLREVAAQYQRRIEATPTREVELVELTRDYDTIKAMYTDLLRKQEGAKLAVNLERRQIGEQFKILDGARVPEKPISPDRLRINLMGLIAGFAVGLLLVVFLEYRDSSLKTEQDVVLALSLPVLALIPAMHSAAERRRAMWRRLVLVTSTALLVFGLAATAVWRSGVIAALVK
jgi:polysaccharide chain length determinant protein (PEP-CTERM system associated)